MTSAAPHLRVVEPVDRNEIEVCTALVRRFLLIGEIEPVELTAFLEGRIWIAHALTAADHVRLLREAERFRGFNGAYMLVNGPMDPALLARYESNKWSKAWNGRATDRDIQQLRAIFLDCDPVRPKGISSTDDEKREAWDVSQRVEAYLTRELGDHLPLGHGCSGNGYFTLIAIQPCTPTVETTAKIGRLLTLLNKKFGTERVKIDCAVANPARLMPAPGTMKRKGTDTPERPHRRTSFSCWGHVTRVPLEVLVG